MTKWLRENLWRHITGIIMCLFALFPLYLVVITSFNESGSLKITSFIPTDISFANYRLLFTDERIPYMTWMKNSLVIASFVAVTSVVIGAASAFAFSRLKFKGKKAGIQVLLLIQMFPAILALSAVYVIMERVYTFAPVDSIPTELDEAAKIDGATPVQTYWLIFVPLAAPVLAVVALLSFIGTFNEFILARLFLVDMESRTVAVGLQQFIGGQFSENWGPFAAGSIIASIPIVIIFLSLQRYIISGLTAGSVKG
jgi:arabinogalactan oligomer/maltooligosaccharide transport system permease protein